MRSSTFEMSHQYKFRKYVIEDRDTVMPTWGVAFCKPPPFPPQRPNAPAAEKEFQHFVNSLEKKNGTADDEVPYTRAEDVQAIRDQYENKYNLFATCGGPAIRIYSALQGGDVTLLQVYAEAKEEIYYSIAWTYNADGSGEYWVVVGGDKGVLRVISVSQKKEIAALDGHGNAIHDVKVHPKHPHLVLTSSKDESLRLWSLRSMATVAVFGGLKGHRGDVLYADFNMVGDRFASCGIDNSIKIWDFTTQKVQESIAVFDRAADLGNKGGFMWKDEHGEYHKFRVPMHQFPLYVSRRVHKHYVDCVKWLGGLLLSKSVHNRILLWDTEPSREDLPVPEEDHTVLLDYPIENSALWFVRFDLHLKTRLLAAGNAGGEVYLFDVSDTSAKPVCICRPPQKYRADSEGQAAIRQCAFNADGSILVAVDDNGAVARYDRIPDVTSSTDSDLMVNEKRMR